MTETVTFDFGGVAFSRTELGAADFSLPARTTRACPANCGGLTEFACGGLTAREGRTKFACGGLTDRSIGALTGFGDACGGLTGISIGALRGVGDAWGGLTGITCGALTDQDCGGLTDIACGGLTDKDLMRGEFFMTNLVFLVQASFSESWTG
jgi:hypothetical protein